MIAYQEAENTELFVSVSQLFFALLNQRLLPVLHVMFQCEILAVPLTVCQSVLIVKSHAGEIFALAFAHDVELV